ncbi:MAG: MFS transporter [DPANN group archaeon]|nr:MFS transporter [DPANN group archaeon]
MHRHYHFHKIHILKNELSEVYMNLSIQSFALSLVSVFIPIYLLKLGYSFNEVIMFFIVFEGTLGFVSPFAATLANKIGFKHIIMLRVPFLITFLLGLNFIETYSISIYLLALIGGGSASLYWNSINSIFAKHSNKLHRGTQTSKLFSIPQIASLAGPTIGGLIALVFGFNILFITTTVFVCISIIPLFFTKDTKTHVNFSFKKMLKFKNNFKYLIYFMFHGIKSLVSYLFWPIFIYWGLQGSTIGMGLSHTITSLGIIAFTFYIGKKSDNMDKFKLIRYGGLLFGILWFVRIFSKGTIDYFILSFLGGLIIVLIDLPFVAVSFDEANKKNPDEFIVFKEFSMNLGKVIFLACTLLVSDAILKIFFGFSVAGIVSLAFILF